MMKRLFSKKGIFLTTTLIVFIFSLASIDKVFANVAPIAFPLGPVVNSQNIIDRSLTYTGGVTSGGIPLGGQGGFGGILTGLFIWGVGITAILAVVMLVVGGIQYMGSESLFGKDEGKKRMAAALGGLLIALASVLILTTIIGSDGAGGGSTGSDFQINIDFGN